MLPREQGEGADEDIAAARHKAPGRERAGGARQSWLQTPGFQEKTSGVIHMSWSREACLWVLVVRAQEGCRLRLSSETSWLSCIWVAFLSLDDRRDDAHHLQVSQDRCGFLFRRRQQGAIFCTTAAGGWVCRAGAMCRGRRDTGVEMDGRIRTDCQRGREVRGLEEGVWLIWGR